MSLFLQISFIYSNNTSTNVLYILNTASLNLFLDKFPFLDSVPPSRLSQFFVCRAVNTSTTKMSKYIVCLTRASVFDPSLLVIPSSFPLPSPSSLLLLLPEYSREGWSVPNSLKLLLSYYYM